jgi:4-carboxymuconolactone decarboxylase
MIGASNWALLFGNAHLEETMSRLPPVDREKLTSDGQAIWDRIAALRSGTMRGPSSILMNRPELASRFIELEDYFRTDAELPAADRELVILATTRELEARFAWARHEVRAKEVGTRGEAIEAVRTQGKLDGLTPRERALVDVVRSVLRTHDVSDEVFASAHDELGTNQLVEAVALAGTYCVVSATINAFHIPEDGPTF